MTLSVDRLAALRPDRVAVVDDTAGRVWQYRDLADRSARTAAALASLGLERGDAVAVVSRTRLEMLALLFATRRLGAALAPLSYRLPTDEVEALCDRLAPAAVVFEPAARDLVRGVPDAVTFEALRAAAEDGDAPIDRGSATDGDGPLLYCHDDDGERVAAFSEGGVERNCASVAAAWGLGRRDAVLLGRPLFEPVGLLQAALPVLWAGGTLVVHRAFDPPDVCSAVETHGPTALVAGALELREVVGHPAFDGTDWSSVEWVATRDAPAAGPRDALRERSVPVVRTYGTFEAGPNVAYVPPGAGLPDDPACLGYPFPDCEVALLDANGTPVSGADAGALAVRGPTTATGTPADPDAFGDGWVRTGDRARVDGDGALWLAE